MVDPVATEPGTDNAAAFINKLTTLRNLILAYYNRYRYFHGVLFITCV